MKIGINIRVMGPQSSRNTIASVLKQAEAAGVESAWIVDHIAIPPDEAEGSGGRYLDPLTSLAWMAGQTQSILIGTSVLILPYRPKLPTAKAIATIQELSGERLLLGVGIGWMDPEFQALGVDRHRRGRLSDETLAFLHECFDNDIVTANDQRFLFKPRPARPPIYIGGSAPHAIDRALKYGDGWLPMGHLDKIAPQIRQYHERSEASQGKPGEVVTFATLPEGDVDRAREMISRYSAAGVTRIIIGRTYESAKDWAPTFELLSALNS
jgi:probable F420-dependent oxidoreductase